MDTRSPYVLSVRDLSHRPGTSRSLELEIPAPADLAIEVIGVPEGSAVRLDLRLDAVVEGILVTGTAQAEATGECVRCLGAVRESLQVPLTELFAYPGAIEADPEDPEAEDVRTTDGDHVDLEQALRDAIVLALPFQPRCRPDCLGLCSECGVDLNTAPADHSHDLIDARWAALVDAFGAPSRSDRDRTTGAEPDLS